MPREQEWANNICPFLKRNGTEIWLLRLWRIATHDEWVDRIQHMLYLG